MRAVAPFAAPLPPGSWRMPRPYGWRSLVVLGLAVLLLWKSGNDVEMDRATALTAEALGTAVGVPQESQVAKGLGTIVSRMFPPQITEVTPVERIPDFDREALPWFTHLEMRVVTVRTLDPEQLQLVSRSERTEVLVEPFGYVLTVLAKLVETIEIALWGTLLAVCIGFPLALLGARNLSPHPVLVVGARALVSLLRAIPELLLALVLVLAYGFGPIAGTLALALHGAGFLGKFYAEDIENADRKPQEALTVIGANRLMVLRFAILPQVLPQYVAYTLYVLDRNVRMAAVIGLVGAGGIGLELKGRYDTYQFAHVGTILIAIFLFVFALDQVSAKIRKACL